MRVEDMSPEWFAQWEDGQDSLTRRRSEYRARYDAAFQRGDLPAAVMAKREYRLLFGDDDE